jgi:polyhydroxyalkanoate synthase subunit PhaC
MSEELKQSRELNRWKGFFQSVTAPNPELGQTPRQAVWKKNKATLWYYPAPVKKYKIPIFFIYSLVNQPTILDLAPNLSFIEALVHNGYDVYLLDFGIPSYEDKDISIDQYITHYIQRGVQQTLRHSLATEITLMGFCLGGTLTTIYTAIAKEPIKNIILFGAPIDFHAYTDYSEWRMALQEGRLDIDSIIDSLGIMPAPLMEIGMRLLTAPVYYSHYLSLLNRSYDENYTRKWRQLNAWTKGHIPLTGAALKQIIHDLIVDNKLITGKLVVGEEPVKLHKIKANLLLVTFESDQLVPKEIATPILDLVSSKDVTYSRVPGGHANLSPNGNLPDYLQSWLPVRSE